MKIDRKRLAWVDGSSDRTGSKEGREVTGVMSSPISKGRDKARGELTQEEGGNQSEQVQVKGNNEYVEYQMISISIQPKKFDPYPLPMQLLSHWQ